MPATGSRWFSYNGTGSPLVPGSYIYTPSFLTTCTSGKKVCAIYAIYRTSGPSIGLVLQGYINTALANGTNQPAGSATTKKYVYVRPV